MAGFVVTCQVVSHHFYHEAQWMVLHGHNSSDKKKVIGSHYLGNIGCMIIRRHKL